MTTPEAQLDRRAFAARLGVDPHTITRGVREHRYPQPDGHVGNHPWWWGSTVAAFDPPKAGRPRHDPTTTERTPMTTEYGPQTTVITALIERAKRADLTEDEEGALFEADSVSVELDQAERAAEQAAVKAGRYQEYRAAIRDSVVAVSVVQGAVKALAVRDLIGQDPLRGDHYRTLGAAWVSVMGPVHPDDERDGLAVRQAATEETQMSVADVREHDLGQVRTVGVGGYLAADTDEDGAIRVYRAQGGGPVYLIRRVGSGDDWPDPRRGESWRGYVLYSPAAPRADRWWDEHHPPVAPVHAAADPGSLITQLDAVVAADATTAADALSRWAADHGWTVERTTVHWSDTRRLDTAIISLRQRSGAVARVDSRPGQTSYQREIADATGGTR